MTDKTIDCEVDEILGDLLRVVTDNDHIMGMPFTQEMADKAAHTITNLIAQEANKARLDQMEYVNQRLIGKNTRGDRVFYDKDAVIAENKLLDRQRVILEAMKAELLTADKEQA